jgi:hypothetical protein
MTAEEARQAMEKAVEEEAQKQFQRAIDIIAHHAKSGDKHCIWYTDDLTEVTKEKLSVNGYRLTPYRSKLRFIFKNPTKISWEKEIQNEK